MSRLAPILDAVIASIREPGAQDRPREELLAGRGLDPRDASALAALDDQAFFVYRRIVRRTLVSAARAELPRTAALLGDRFAEEVERFLSRGLSASPYLRDVAFELVEHATDAWPGRGDVPPFALDLARHELAAFRATSAPRRGARVVAALELDAPCSFDESVSLSRHAYPVHELAPGQTTLEPRATALLVYRDDEGDARFLALSPLAAAILEHALDGVALGEAIQRGARSHGAALSEGALSDIATLLSDLAARGVLLGRPARQTTMEDT